MMLAGQRSLVEPDLLPIRQVPKPWGCDHLPEPFIAQPGDKIGEIWFEPPTEAPDLLVKYIFTSEKLSVQVHPSDEQTMAQGIGRQGKEECWLVIAAEPGAQLGIGFAQSMDANMMRTSALDGSIEQKLVWHSVKLGDFFYIPANTVHAIGAGISLIEVQQNSDITYRLYDYGRPRKLHLTEAIAVAQGEAYDLALWHRQIPERGTYELVNGPYFRMHRVEGPPNDALAAAYDTNSPLLVLPVTAGLQIKGINIKAGSCALIQSIDQIDADITNRYILIQPNNGLYGNKISHII